MRNLQFTAVLASLLSANAGLCGDSKSVRTGEYQLTFTLTEVTGTDAAGEVESVISPDKSITWDVYVPGGYRLEKPAGLLVYISPTPSGDIPRRWKSVMDERNMIWIAARSSGNRVMTARRAIYAIYAPTLAGKHYTIDHERIYLAGLSGGGKVASVVATDFPQVFKGAMYNCGVKFWGERSPRQIELVKQNHYVFITGTRDHALKSTKKVHEQYLESGVVHSTLMVIHNMDHRNPDSDAFDEAIQYLDSRISPEAPTKILSH